MKPTAKPYATSFTFDPADGTIWYDNEHGDLALLGQFVPIIRPDIRDRDRRKATAKLLADAPGALVECHAALAGLFALGDSEIERPLTLRKGWPKFIVQVNSAILRAETVLGIEKGKP